MKYLLYITLSLALFISCKKEKIEPFNVDVPIEMLKFRPIPGGAVMSYSIPESRDIYAINVYYTDGQGVDTRISGSYLSDSLVIIGFTDARSSIPAKITFENRDQNESEPINMTFSTDVSGTVSIFEELKVINHWGGFRVEYKGMPNTKGIVNVFYEGVNPLTNEPDMILVDEFPISEVDEAKNYTLEKGSHLNNILIRTQDNRGYFAMQKRYSDIKSLKKMKIEYGESFGLLDPFYIGIEDSYHKLGVSYLFDGDTKGENTFGITEETNYSTFMAGPDAISTEDTPKYLVIDLKEARQVAALRLHTMLDVRIFPPIIPIGEKEPILFSAVWSNQYPTLLPCRVIAYASNSVGDTMEDKVWVKLEEYQQYPNISQTLRWSNRSPENGSKVNKIKDLGHLAQSKEQYLSIEFSASIEKYRYIRFDVLDTFDHYSGLYVDKNSSKYFSFNELEVFIEDNK